MRGLLCLALCSLLLSASSAHDVEDDFDDEAEVEIEAEDTVVVEKVTNTIDRLSSFLVLSLLRAFATQAV